MNKKDLRELKKNFSDTSDLFTMNHVVTAFVDAEKGCSNMNFRRKPMKKVLRSRFSIRHSTQN